MAPSPKTILCLIVWSLALVGGAFVWGASAYKARSYPISLLERLDQIANPGAAFTDTSRRIEVDCKSIMGPDTMVALAFGQSNAANRKMPEERIINPQFDVYNFFAGHCYRAQNPMLGADGTGNSVWTLLGDRLISSGSYRRVIFATIARGGSAISQWAPGGNLNGRLITALDSLQAAGLRPTHLLWHQGETDAEIGTPPDTYRRSFSAMLDAIRERGVDAPIWVSVTTMCRNKAVPAIEAAQRALVSPTTGIFAGPDTDSLGFFGRGDACHFNDEGKDRVADLWLEALRRAR